MGKEMNDLSSDLKESVLLYVDKHETSMKKNLISALASIGVCSKEEIEKMKDYGSTEAAIIALMSNYPENNTIVDNILASLYSLNEFTSNIRSEYEKPDNVD